MTFLLLFLTLLLPQMHGIGVGIQYNDPDLFPVGIPFVTWNSAYCHRAEFVPMVWRQRLPDDSCNDGRPLLLFNEPESETQANLTPYEAAQIVAQYADWLGPVYCCGNGWNDYGYEWFMEFLSYDPAIDGLHLHTYSWYGRTLYASVFADRWVAIAEQHEWPIIISEWGLPRVTDEAEMVRLLPKFAWLLEQIFQPDMMFYFGWFAPDVWPECDMINEDGTLTAIGEAWFLLRDDSVVKTEYQLWLPWLTKAEAIE